MNTKYSFLMSIYKKEKPEYLKLALDSMVHQTVIPDEIVIVKDGSLTEELEDTLNFYCNRWPSIFHFVVNETNIGLGLSLNKGLRVCKNELVARMDSDDISKSDRCEKQLRLFEEDKDLCIVGSYVDEFMNTTDNVVSVRKVPTGNAEIYDFAKRRSAFNHPVVMYRKSKVLEQNGYANLRRNQDVDLFGRMLFAGCKAANIGESLLFYRSSDDLAKRRKSWENTRSYIATIYKQYKSGYSNLIDFVIVSVAQLAFFLMPAFMQHFLYKHFLRR